MGGLTLLAPLTLIGLLALPLVWLILRISPPAPKREAFPPLAILRGVETDEETPNATPWWLLLFRLSLIALTVFALSLPLLQRDDVNADAPLTLILDDSALSAAAWDTMTDEARLRLETAQRANQEVIFITGGASDVDPIPAAEALQRLRSARPQLQARTRSILPELPAGRQTIFITSGATYAANETLNTALQDQNVSVITAPLSLTPIVPGDVRETADGFEADWYALSGGRQATIEALAANGSILASEPIAFGPTQTLATASVRLPPQLRSRVASLRVAGARASVSTKLLDDGFGRPLVGVLAPPSGTSSPLLSEAFYAEQALTPFADLFIGDADTVLSLNPSVLVMPDSMSAEAPRVAEYVEAGGIVVRFAGPQLAQSPDDLVPVDLRQGGRSIGGALAWETPQALAPFEATSPFAGVSVPNDVRVSRQVMARPGAETDARTWARLEDGSPVVTSAVRGEGRVVLFHVTAGPEWSNLAISGLYVDLLKRILPLAKTRRVTLADNENGADYVLDRLLDPFGQLRPPPLQVVQVRDSAFNATDPAFIPGLYRQGTRQVAVNAIGDVDQFQRLDTDGLNVSQISGQDPRSLAGWLLGIALLLLSVDVLFSAILSGRVRWSGRSSRGSQLAACLLGAILLAFSLNPSTANAQSADIEGVEQRIAEAALGLHLAFVETGDARIDDLSRAAIESVAYALTSRTTVEPVGVHGVTPDSEGLELYPFLYWPIRLDTPALTEEERATINGYIAAGGTLVLDTADEAERTFRAGAPHPGLQRLTEGLNIGRLTAVSRDHVMTKSFYLTQVFPGRWASGPVFVEAGDATQGGRDGVSSVIIGSNDWAAGWAIDETTGGLVELSNDIPRQREMATRFGVNLAMYTLSGNYKSDQVHAADLIERLGRGETE